MELNKWYDISKTYNTKNVKHVVYFYPTAKEKIDDFSCYDGKIIKKHFYNDKTSTLILNEDSHEVIYDSDLPLIEEVSESMVNSKTNKFVKDSENKLFNCKSAIIIVSLIGETIDPIYFFRVSSPVTELNFDVLGKDFYTYNALTEEFINYLYTYFKGKYTKEQLKDSSVSIIPENSIITLNY